MGLIGPVPPRVDADTKAELLAVVEEATAAGWTLARVCGVLQITPERIRAWRRRAELGQLADRRPGRAVHAITPHEQAAILEITEAWKDIDRSHRKLAHRGSREQRVWVSESTFLRVLQDHDVDMPAPPPPPARAPVRLVLPEGLAWEPNNIWIYDASSFARADRDVVLVADVVSRKWLSTVVSPEWTSTQVEVAFGRALQAEELEQVIAQRLDDPELVDPPPVLLAWSDNGPQMISEDTRSFMALHLIAQHFGRPGTPTDQAWIESLIGHLKSEHPYLTRITDPNDLEHELEDRRTHYNTVRLHAGIGYVTPDEEHHGRGHAIRQARREGMARARQQRLDYHRKIGPDRPKDAV